MIDTSEGLPNAPYLAEVDDPEHCNALSAGILHELFILKFHPHPIVAREAANLVTGKVSEDFLQWKCVDVYRMYDTSTGVMNPPLKAPKPNHN